MNRDGRVNILLKADGVYIAIDYTNDKTPVKRSEVLALVEGFGVKDIDFVAINALFKAEGDFLEQKISSNTAIVQDKENVTITVSKDKLKAFIKFAPSKSGAGALTEDEILNAINEKNIRYGIKADTIKELAYDKIYGEDYLIAEGKPPVPGVDGYYQFHFDVERKSGKPEILEDGTVDFRKLHLFETTVKGEKLITIIPPQNGEEGTSVYGDPISFKPPKPANVCARGKNAILSPEGDYIYADCNGQIIYQDKKIDVSPVFNVEGNVDSTTGNIDFNGTVTIRGNVMTGFTVSALGNIDILGIVEGATIISEGNILIGSGVQGAKKAVIKASGNVQAKYLANCTLTCGGDLSCESILHSDVKCSGTIELIGKSGNVVGGSITVGKKLLARVIGSSMSTFTEIKVGHAPEVLDEYKNLSDEIDKLRVEIKNIDNNIILLNTAHSKGLLTDEKKLMLIKILKSKAQKQHKLEELEVKYTELNATLKTQSGIISASQVIYPGVKVLIGDAVMIINDNINNARLRNSGGKIVVSNAV